MNKFKLSLPENSFGYPCNICANRERPVTECRYCDGYGGALTFPVDQADLRALMEAPRAESASAREGEG
jgi:hypothetical protein